MLAAEKYLSTLSVVLDAHVSDRLALSGGVTVYSPTEYILTY